MKWLTPQNFPGINGDGTFNPHGFDIRVDSKSKEKLHIILVNHRPSYNKTTGELLDQTKVGANSTIEHFETILGSDEMVHKQTFTHSNVRTPSHVVWVNENLFIFTNSHDRKIRSVSCPSKVQPTLVSNIDRDYLLSCTVEVEVLVTAHLPRSVAE